MRTMGETPADETAPACGYMPWSSMAPRSESMRTHRIQVRPVRFASRAVVVGVQ